ncbi:Mlp family lipoprotein (plasmid) [Borrelia miyamotoi]|uniref:Mlp family lipoprotein n=1 Tax=Borrelia miyamotoi TaxID=47466 RepID=A0A5P8ARA8_9SPIR|nr:Mlp family lipoprotein [Borrelia miyamotoi]QFP42450.1 Mlp family lipoprotein [Borrelia miyamotoi]WAZ72293.1 Mlp family lipoprotein [Borrelia miyamotoi]WVI05288.1 Mlp family lipoprotein [Borrelia miyamotoi]
MRKVGYMLITLLLISSCGNHDFIEKDKEPKNRSKRDLGEQSEIQKTPEEELKEKLSVEEKQGLNFLKEALGDNNKLNEILKKDENLVKEALKHINTELVKCTGDNANDQKETFKQVVKGALNGDLNKFKEQASSTCNS